MPANFKAIPLNGSIISYADMEEVGETQSPVLINSDYMKPGVLSSRVPNSKNQALPYNFFKLFYWSDKIGSIETEVEPVWVGFYKVVSSDNERANSGDLEIYYTEADPSYSQEWTNANAWKLWTVIPEWDEDTLSVLNLGGSLRIICGWKHPVVYIDYINRAFFNNFIIYNDYYVDRNATPRPYWYIESAEKMASGNLSTGFYYYKIAPVLDGVQIGALADNIARKVQITDAVDATAKLTLRIDTNDWNPRITHLNMYRGHAPAVDNEDAVTYYLTNSIRTTSNFDAPNISINIERLRSHAFIGTGNIGPGQCSVGDGAYTNQSACEDVSVGGTWSAGLDVRSAFTGDNGDWLITGIRHPDPDGTAVLDNSVSQVNAGLTFLVSSVDGFKPMMTWQESLVTGADGVGGLQCSLEMGSGYQDPGSSNETAYQRSRNAGSHWRRIRKVEEDYVVCDWPFWKEDEWLDYGNQQRPAEQRQRGNGQWGVDTGNDYCNAIVSRFNELTGSGKSYASWTLHDPGDSEISIGNSGGVDEYIYLRHKNHAGDTGDSDWSIVYAHDTVTLENGYWYFLTLSFHRLRTDTGAKAEMWLNTCSNTSTNAGHGGSNLFKLEYAIRDTSDNHHSQMCGWFYMAGTQGTYTDAVCSIGNVSGGGNGININERDKHEIRLPGIFKCIVPPTNQGWFGTDVIGVPKNIVAPTLPAVSMQIGSSVNIQGDSSNERTVIDSMESTHYEMIRIDDELSITSNSVVTLNALYDIETVPGEEGMIDVIFTDNGYIDGELHSNQDSSLTLRYKHAQMINGRLIVGNILLDPDNQKEAHPNYLMFSELNRPDVIPVTNYIAVSDLGDGEITALKELQGSLIIFSKNKIFRLNIPSYDPMQWSLMETTKGIGCEAKDAICEVQGTVFFSNETGIYAMDANFMPQCITNVIKNVHQKLYTKSMKLYHDVKDNKLFVIYNTPNDSVVVYVMHLNRFPKEPFWVRYSDNPLYDDYSNVSGSAIYNPTLFLSDSAFNTWCFNDTKTGISNLRRLKCVETPDVYGGEDNKHIGGGFYKETGWIRLSTMDQPVTLRRIHVRYQSAENLGIYICVDENHPQEPKMYWDYPNAIDFAVRINGTRDIGGSIEPNTLRLDKNIEWANNTIGGKHYQQIEKEHTYTDDLGNQQIELKKMPLKVTEKLGIRCWNFKLVIKVIEQGQQLDKTEIHGIEVEYE